MKKNRLLVSALLVALSLVKNLHGTDSTAAAGGGQVLKRSPAQRRLQAEGASTNRLDQESAALPGMPLQAPRTSHSPLAGPIVTRRIQVMPAACLYLADGITDDEAPLEASEFFDLLIDESQPELTTMDEACDSATTFSQSRSSSSPLRYTGAPVSASAWPEYLPTRRDTVSRARSCQEELALFGPDDTTEYRMTTPAATARVSSGSRASSSSNSENNKSLKAKFQQQCTDCMNNLRDAALRYQNNKEQRAVSVNGILAGYLNEISLAKNNLKELAEIHPGKRVLRLGQLKNNKNSAKIMAQQICSTDKGAEYQENITALYNAFRGKTRRQNSVVTFLKGLTA